MTALLHTCLLLLSLVAAYVWLQIPGLRAISLQAFAACLAGYLGLKRLHKAQIWHLAPSALPLELGLITFAFLLVIGFSGGINSLLFPLTYVLLFFLVFTTRLTVTLITTGAIVLFFYIQADISTPHTVGSLLTIPLLFFFFAFAKAQYQQASRGQVQLTTDEALLTSYQHGNLQLSRFLTSFLQPKLQYISSLLEYPADNKHALQSQLALIQVEIEKIVSRAKPDDRAISQAIVSTDTQVEIKHTTTTQDPENQSQTIDTTAITRQTTRTHASLSPTPPTT